MNIFISWSGDRSKSVASGLKMWLPNVFQDVTAWMSDHDIDAGTRWAPDLSARLEEMDYEIVCLTEGNINAAWLLFFEAGSLAKSVMSARVVPYLVDLSPADVTYPLAQFQSASADKDRTLKLVQSINKARNLPLGKEQLETTFEKWWEDLNQVLKERSPAIERAAVRSEREILCFPSAEFGRSSLIA